MKNESKLVREALEARYAELARAVENKDIKAFEALRTPDFHTVDEHGHPQTAKQMAARARALLQRIQPPIKVMNIIRTLNVQESDVTATVEQYFSKMLEIDGELRRVETYVTQDETWTNTPEGWKLRFVAGVRDNKYFIDGKPFDPPSRSELGPEA